MIPLQKPLLPNAKSLLPYLERIDGARYYSNTGPLVMEFERRLEEMFGVPCVTASSATLALAATLLAFNLPKGSLVACPSWTFLATPASIVLAGHIPYFVDAYEETVPHNVLSDVLVPPFGEPAIYGESDIPSVIDAAGGFDSFSSLSKSNNTPVVVSTHATKTLGTGEGGFVACGDASLLEKIRAILNFGMDKKREAKWSGLNGKMSEYHAAVGLAGLDEWPEKRVRWIEARGWYEKNLGENFGKIESFASSVLSVVLPVPAKPVSDKMKEKNIQTKVNWYGCHQHEAYAHFSRDDLKDTDRLAETTISLPMFLDIKKEDVDYVCQTLRELL